MRARHRLIPRKESVLCTERPASEPSRVAARARVGQQGGVEAGQDLGNYSHI
jgi:hypothetical protein